MESDDDFDFDIPETLDLTSTTVDFNEMQRDIQQFASEPSVKTILEAGEDLQNYNDQIAKELDGVEADSREDYLRQKTRVESLHGCIIECDSILELMENDLLTFQQSLGKIADEIDKMQTRSNSIRLGLDNRQKFDSFLGEFVDTVSISTQLSTQIATDDVLPPYIRVLEEFDRKIQFLQRKDIKNSVSAQTQQPVYANLIHKAAENIKKWLFEQVNQFKSGDDILTVQNCMLRCKFASYFLKTNSPDIAATCHQYYVDTMSRIYQDMFKSQTKRIPKLMASIVQMQETIIPNSQPQGFFKSKRIVSGQSALFFSLGDRSKLLADYLAPPQEFTESSYPFESLVRSLFQTLIDSVTSEHFFAADFFCDEKITEGIFQPSTQIIEQFLNTEIPKIYDPICIILLLRFAYAHKGELERRRVYILDQFFKRVIKIYTDRFLQIIDININAIENCDPRMFIEREETSFHANAMSRRFSQFISSLLLLLNDQITDLVTLQLHRVAAPVIDLIEKISRYFSSENLAVIFLINNYNLILSTATMSPYGSIVAQSFDTKVTDCTGHYIELELAANFPKLVDAVRHTFKKIEYQDEPSVLDIGEAELREIATGFRDNHIERFKQFVEEQNMKIDDLNKRGIIILNLSKRLTLYWSRFYQLCQASLQRNNQLFQVLIKVQQLAVDLKKITESYQ